MIALAFLPLMAFGGIFGVMLHLMQVGQFTNDWRSVFIRAALIWGAYLVLVTELLSLVRGIRVAGLAIAWVLPVIASIIWLMRQKRWPRVSTTATPARLTPVSTAATLEQSTPVEQARRFSGPQSRPSIDWGNRVLLLGISIILVITALVAWITPPQTYDSLNYHLPRVAHWAQEGAVRHFATGIDVQNVLTPGAELIVLHFYVLAGGDRLANFPEWLSLLGSLIVVSWTAALMGADRRGQVLAVVVAATIPMGIVQASSTMTDFVTAFWVACAAAEVLQLLVGTLQPAGLIFASLAAGLALLTKPTAAAFVLPFGALVSVLLWIRWGVKRTVLWAGIGVVLVIGISAGHLARNAALYGNPLGDQARLSTHGNELLTPQAIFSNLIRNAALHSGSPWGRANQLVYNLVLKIHDWLGLSVDDPRTTAVGPYGWVNWRTEENITGNFTHALLILWCLVFTGVAYKHLGRVHLLYVLLVALAFVLFSVIFKWQKFGGRYHMPFFILFAPAVAYTLSLVLRRKAAWLLGLLLVLGTYPWLISIDSRPLIPTSNRSYPVSILQESRQRLYFANATYLDYPYHEIAAYIKDADCLQVGLNMGGMAAEYPLWMLLGAPRPDLQIEWLVSGRSARYAKADFRPCAVICDGCDGQQAYNGLPFVHAYDSLRLYLQPNTGK